MAMFLIPTEPFEANYQIRVTLDGRDFLLDFDYSQRADCWSFSISSVDGTLIRAGMKVVCETYPLRKIAGYAKPPGQIVVLDESGDRSPPKFGELGEGRRCVMYYLDAAELAAAAAS